MYTGNKTDLPPESIEQNGHRWERTQFDKNSFQWVREMSGDEYSWDLKEVRLVGTDVPIRVISLQHLDKEWHVEASETAGPDYHRPGLTELISSEYSRSTSDIEEASKVIQQFIEQLS